MISVVHGGTNTAHTHTRDFDNNSIVVVSFTNKRPAETTTTTTTTAQIPCELELAYASVFVRLDRGGLGWWVDGSEMCSHMFAHIMPTIICTINQTKNINAINKYALKGFIVVLGNRLHRGKALK